MASEQGGDQVQFLLSDFNTRLRDVDERSRLIRERVLLLGKNLISSRADLEETISQVKKDNDLLQKQVEHLHRLVKLLSSAFNQFVKRDELVLVERMLRDFEPLEFVRRKDVELMIADALKSSKQINSDFSLKK